MTISVFIGTSVDGFIARPNDDLDFLPEGGGEPHGYVEFMATVDALVIGRRTFEKVLTFGKWPYGEKRVVVLSRSPLDLAVVDGVANNLSEDLIRSWLGLFKCATVGVAYLEARTMVGAGGVGTIDVDSVGDGPDGRADAGLRVRRHRGPP